MRTFISIEEAQATYHALCQHVGVIDISTTLYRLDKVRLSAWYERLGQYATISFHKVKYFELNYLTDFFTEPSRMRAPQV